SITDSSLKILRPTIRSPGSKIYFSFNRKSLRDPVYDLFLRHKTKKYKMKFTDENGDSFYWFLHKGDGCIRIEINWDGNPFFPNELNNDRLLDLETQPVEEYQHVWEGLPEPQPKDSVVDVTECNNAMKRTIIPKGDWSIGVDVARSGKDKVDIFVRRGMTVTKMVEFKNKSKNEKMRTWETAERVMKLSDEISPHKDIPIKVDDTGVGGGVTDYLEKFGYNVIPVNFQQKAIDEEHYANAISEMWFTFNKIINQVDIPDNKELLEDLTNRSEIARDNKSRRRIEPKDIFKKRMGRSPDKGDGLLLCFYEPEQATIGFITVRQ
ncbi:hypothetical protein KAR91_47475, partial [Candidatus Pacearchaeota archaeon]|nr:hypothetical protein [Candidatus Pacearchaeota archaeon]